MKRYMAAAANTGTTTINNISDWEAVIMNDRRSHYEDRTGYRKKFIFSPEVLLQLYQTNSDFLYWLRDRATNFKQIKQQLSELTDSYDWQLHGNYTNTLAQLQQDFISQLKSYKLKGVSASVGRDCTRIRYGLDPDRYDLASTEYSGNAEALKEWIETIPAVDHVTLESGYSDESFMIDVYWSTRSQDIQPDYDIEFGSIPLRSDEGCVYKLSIAHGIVYMSNKPFHWTTETATQPGNIPYMVSVDKITAPDSSIQSFVNSLWNEAPQEFNSWDELFSYLDNQVYTNGKDQLIYKISRITNGTSKQIYSRELP